MRSAYGKEVLRSITGSLGRFIAIAAIVALGCGFYGGLRMVYPDMNLAADRFYDGTHLMDVRVVSTMGLTDEDLAALGAVEGVANVMGAYETDVVGDLGEDRYTFRVHSLPPAAAQSRTVDAATVASDDDDFLNRPVLAEGRWPEAPDECVISADSVMVEPVAMGDAIQVVEGIGTLDEVLVPRTFKVVGLVHSSYYVAFSSLGTSSLGSGFLDQFMYVPPTAFAADYPYTEAFLTVEGASDLLSSDAAYDQRVEEVMASIEAIAAEREEARLAGIRSEAQEELDAARGEYQDEKARAETELADAQRKLNGAAGDIARGERELADAEQTVRDNEQKLADGKTALEEGRQELACGRMRLERETARAEQRFAEAQGQIDAATQQVQGLQGQLAGVQQQLARPDLSAEERTQLESTALALQQGIAAGQKGIDDGKAALAAGREQLAAETAQAEAELAAAEQRLAEAAREIADGEAQLADGRESLEAGRNDLAQGRADYAQGLADYSQGRAEADAEFADAESELARAQADIDGIERPEWLIMGRDKNYGAVSFAADAERVDHIASVFPFIFFLVAALVALTTMTRMVEEERGLIGTFKALGYSRYAIIAKYLVYAGVASLVGAIVGIGALSFVLPAIVMEAYSIMYYVPSGAFPLHWPITLTAAALGVGITLIATYAAAGATLRETPAQLMLPRAPKAGKRILMERIRPLWSRLSFSWKVTFRNLFRYKKRLVMTLIGIAGCTALLLTGFGLSDAINGIIDKQYGQIIRYDATVVVEDDLGEDERAAIDRSLASSSEVAGSATVLETAMLALAPDGMEKSVTVVVPEDEAALTEQLVMRERVGSAPIALGEGGIAITEKLADLLGVSVGDTVTFAEQDAMGNATSAVYDFSVGSIMENYVGNYAFLTAEQYEAAFGEAAGTNTVYLTFATDEVDRDGFRETVRALDGVKTLSYTDEALDTYRTMLKSVNMIVVVLVIAAAALAFIVLYNLTNINITERVREIATLKVLGFTSREVDLYIYRETMLLSVLGCVVGLLLGVFLESFVILSAEVDQVMFSRDIFPISFVYAFLLTLLFTVFVMVVMRRKLASVDMVESLKSNE